MTILPKKKSSGSTKAESESSEGHHAHSLIGQDANRERHPLASEDGAGPSKRRHRASPHRSVRKHRGPSTAPGGSGLSVPQMPSTSAGAMASVQVEEGKDCPSAGDVQGPGGVNAEDTAGYNSSDEYGNSAVARTEEDWTERELGFEKKMRKQGMVIKNMGEDGACLFRAVADQVYGDQEMHATVRKQCMDYMAKNSDYYSQYVTEEFDTYLERKRMDHIHGNHVEMQALSEMYNRTLEVYHYSSEPINIFQGSHSTDNEPIRLSYHKNIHYNSIVNPYKATVGVGLGLPGFVPGLAEKNQMGDAVRQSEDLHIEQAMLEDKLKATDWEATNEAIEEQVARESYLEWLRDNERRARKQSAPRAATATCSSSLGAAASPGNHSPRNRGLGSPSGSPPRDDKGAEEYGPSSSSGVKDVFGENLMMGGQRLDNAGKSGCSKPDFALLETASFMNQLPPDVFGLSEWEDADILAQVLAASQQEYLDGLKRTAASSQQPNCSTANSSSSPAALEYADTKASVSSS